jgi:hypothetical protein
MKGQDEGIRKSKLGFLNPLTSYSNPLTSYTNPLTSYSNPLTPTLSRRERGLRGTGVGVSAEDR